VDYGSSYPEILVTKNITSQNILVWLRRLFARYGNPEAIVSDNGPQFISQEFEQFLQQRDIHHYRSPVYSPQENGLVERFNKYLKHGIQAFTAQGTSWDKGLQQLLMQYRATSPTSEPEQSPASRFLGHAMRQDCHVNRNEPKRHVFQQSQVWRSGDEGGSKQPPPIIRAKYGVGQMVVTRLPHVPKGLSPYGRPLRVQEVLGYHTFMLSDGQKWNSRRLKPWTRNQVDIEEIQTPPATIDVRRGSRIRKPPVRYTPMNTRTRAVVKNIVSIPGQSAEAKSWEESCGVHAFNVPAEAPHRSTCAKKLHSRTTVQ